MENNVIDFKKLLSPENAKSFTKEETIKFLSEILKPLLDQPMAIVFHREAVEVSMDRLQGNMADHVSDISFQELITAMVSLDTQALSLPLPQKTTAVSVEVTPPKASAASSDPAPTAAAPGAPAPAESAVKEKKKRGKKGSFDYAKAKDLMIDFLKEQNDKDVFPSSKVIKVHLAEAGLILNPSRWQALRKKFPCLIDNGEMEATLVAVGGKGSSTMWQIELKVAV
jgi:hypothetical protein